MCLMMTRDPRELNQHNYVVSESYVLDGVELGWDVVGDMHSSDNVFTDRIMEILPITCCIRYKKIVIKEAGIITARSEHQLDKSPYFVYDTVYTDGYPWNTITDSGKYKIGACRGIIKSSVRYVGIMGYTLYRFIGKPYLASVCSRRYYEGVYENGKMPIKAFTANNNGIMLESLLYKVKINYHE